MSHDQALQKVGEIQALHPDWDPNDIYEALCTTKFNNAQAILKLMIQVFEFWRDLSDQFSPRNLDKARKATIEPSPHKNESESPFASVGMIQQQYYKEQREKREGTIVDYFDRSNHNSGNTNMDDHYNHGFPSDEENNYYDDDFQATERNQTSTISSPKKKSNPTNQQRSRDNRPQNHVTQAQYAYTAKEMPAKKSSATQSQIGSYIRSGNSDAENKPQASYKSQYSYFGSGFKLRSKTNVHSKVENSSRKRKRSKFLDDFWNSDEEELDDVYTHNNSYNSDSDNTSYNKHNKKSPSEKIQSFKSKYFQQKSHEQITDDKIDKNDDQYGESYQEEGVHNEPEEHYQQNDERTNQNTAINSRNEQQQYAEHYQEEYEDNDYNNNDVNEHYENEAQAEYQNYDEEVPQEEQLQQTKNHGAKNDVEYQEEYNDEYFEDDKEDNKNVNNKNTSSAKIEKEIDAKIDEIEEDGPSLFIPTITIDSETPDPILVSDSDSSQLTAPASNSSINSNNPIVIDSSPIRNESTENKSNNKTTVQNKKKSDANNINTNQIADDIAYFQKIKNATANKRRKIILD